MFHNLNIKEIKFGHSMAINQSKDIDIETFTSVILGWLWRHAMTLRKSKKARNNFFQKVEEKYGVYLAVCRSNS